MKSSAAKIRRIARVLTSHYGAQNWWPAESPFEVVVGAILTQNTAWNNVEKAIAKLRDAGALDLDAMRKLPLSELEVLVRSSGYYRQKAQRLKNFIAYLDSTHGGSLERMFATPTAGLREQLLRLNGIGPETADSILLYGGGHEVFVVDAYTRRILDRHGVSLDSARKQPGYEEIRTVFERSLRKMRLPELHRRDQRHPAGGMSSLLRSEKAQLLNEMHAVIVRVGNSHCRSVARCEGCPLQKLLPTTKPLRAPIRKLQLTKKSGT